MKDRFCAIHGQKVATGDIEYHLNNLFGYAAFEISCIKGDAKTVEKMLTNVSFETRQLLLEFRETLMRSTFNPNRSYLKMQKCIGQMSKM